MMTKLTTRAQWIVTAAIVVALIVGLVVTPSGPDPFAIAWPW